MPILVLTADITESTRERALAVGARDFLTKPFRYTELLLRINNLLETRALHTQLRRDKAILEARMREQQATDQARAERRRSASRRIEAVLASDRNGPTPESGIGLQIVYQPILDLLDRRGARAPRRCPGSAPSPSAARPSGSSRRPRSGSASSSSWPRCAAPPKACRSSRRTRSCR